MTERQTEHVIFELREAAVERLQSERLMTAVVVPYGETSMSTPYPDGERFTRGAFTRNLTELAAKGRRIKLFRGHDHSRALGFAERWDFDDPRGLVGDFRIAETPQGDEAIREVELGLLDQVSVGFQALSTRRGLKGVREVMQARMLETSLTGLGAYDGAVVVAMREQGAADDELAARLKLATALPPMPAYDPAIPLRIL